MSFSSRRRNYLLTPHRRDGLIEWMKSMLQHSFVLDALETTGADTFSHFELLVEEHRLYAAKEQQQQPSRLQQLVPTIGMFHTPLPLRAAFTIYNEKHRLTKRKHIQISFNEIRHILNLAQIMAMRKNREGKDDHLAMSMSRLLPDAPIDNADALLTTPDADDEDQRAMLSAGSSSDDGEEEEGDCNDGDDAADADASSGNSPSSSPAKQKVPQQLNGPRLISFDGDQTLYSDGQNFERNPKLANYLYQLLRHGVSVAIVTAAGYEYNVEKYEYRLSGLLHYFKTRGLTKDECERFYLFGGECNYLLQLWDDYRLHPVREDGPGGWMTSTRYISEAPVNWDDEQIKQMLDAAERQVAKTVDELNLRGRVIRKRRSVGLVPVDVERDIPRESLDETVLRIREDMQKLNGGAGPKLPYCAFNGGSDVWIDVGNKRVGVQILQSYLGIPAAETLHIGDQFLNTGNDFAARDVSPCIWIINPNETTYILKSILRLAGVSVAVPYAGRKSIEAQQDGAAAQPPALTQRASTDFQEVERRAQAAAQMDVYTGELK